MFYIQLLILCFSLLFSLPASAQIVVNGSTTFDGYVFKNPSHDFSGLTQDYKVFPTSTGRGLRALHDGKADIAMMSSPLESVVEKLRSKKGININPDDYIVHEIGSTKSIYIVHSDNPIESLTKEQVVDLLKGKITNWSQLIANSDLGDVRVITEHPTGGIYTSIEKQLLGGDSFADGKTAMQNAPQVSLVTSQLPQAFGFLSDSAPQRFKDKVKILNTPEEASAVLTVSLVAKKNDDRDEIKSFIQAIKDVVKK